MGRKKGCSKEGTKGRKEGRKEGCGNGRKVRKVIKKEG